MKKCIVFGGTYYSELLGEYLETYADIQVEAYVVHKEYLNSHEIVGKPVISFEKIEELYPVEEYPVVLGIGNTEMNNLRKRVYEEVKAKGYVIESFIHPDAKIYTKDIGEGNIILENVTICPHVHIGNGNIIWNGCNISHHTYVGDFNFLAPSVVTGGKVTIGNNCFFGVNSTIKSGTTVADYTLVGAASYLAKASQEYDVYVYGKRDKLENKKSLEMKI